jgi:molybdenum cofactor guanylyltransferase
MLFHMAKTNRSRMGFVLAGGKSSRMGANSDKVFLDFGGRTLLDRALTAIWRGLADVTIVGEPAKFAKYASAKYGVVADIFPGCGPLGRHSLRAHAFVGRVELDARRGHAFRFPRTSCVSVRGSRKRRQCWHAIVTVPRTSRGLQPLCAIYRREFSAVPSRLCGQGSTRLMRRFRAYPFGRSKRARTGSGRFFRAGAFST